MKVAILCDSQAWGGLEMNVFKLGQQLKQRNHQVMLFVHPFSTLNKECHLENLSSKSIDTKYKYFDLGAAIQLAKEINKENFKVLLINLSGNIYLAALTKIILKLFYLKNIRLIYIQHMELGVRKKGIAQTFVYSMLHSWVSPLKILADQVFQKTNIKKEKIKVIPLGIDIRRFENIKVGKAEARNFLNIPEDLFLIGTVGRIDSAKGQEYLIKALPHIHKIYPGVALVIVGDETKGGNRYKTFLKEITESLHLGNHVYFQPFVKDPAIAYGALDIFALTSISETYGTVTLEAMAAGLPIVATNSGGTPELLSNGKFGILVPPKNEVELAKAIISLLSDSRLRERLGREGQQASLNYSYDTQCKLLEQLISS